MCLCYILYHPTDCSGRLKKVAETLTMKKASWPAIKSPKSRIWSGNATHWRTTWIKEAVMIGVLDHCVRRDFTGVEIWSSKLWTARWSMSFVWIWNKDFGNAKRRPRKATARLVPHQTTAVPTCVTFTGDKGAAFCYQRCVLGDVKTMQCVGPVPRDRLCLRCEDNYGL